MTRSVIRPLPIVEERHDLGVALRGQQREPLGDRPAEWLTRAEVLHDREVAGQSHVETAFEANDGARRHSGERREFGAGQPELLSQLTQTLADERLSEVERHAPNLCGGLGG
jgi:hypothetical protein